MALQGTIDAFPVVDVLQLLAGAHKTGRLIVEGDRSTAQLFVVDGAATGGGVQGLELSDLSDVVVELLRYQEGSFLFEPGSTAPDPDEPSDLTELVAAAHERLAAWSAVEAVVPSLAHRLALVPEIGADGIVLGAADWPAVVAAGAQARVGDLVASLGTSDLAGCALVADLVERGVLVVEPPRAELVPMEPAAPVSATTDDGEHEVLDAEVVESEPGAGFELVDVESEETPATEEQAYEVVLLDEAEQDGSFPEHFPIDDLLGADEEEDPWVQLEAAGREERLAAAQFADDAEAEVAGFADGYASGAFSSEGFSSADTAPAGGEFEPAAFDGGAADSRTAGYGEMFEGAAPDAGSPGAAASWDDQQVGGFSDLGAFTDPVEPGTSPAAQTGLGATFVGEGAFTEEPVRTPLAVQDPIVSDRAADTAADEVLRQMSKLSPKAAEAIAAALGSAADDPTGRGQGTDGDAGAGTR